MYIDNATAYSNTGTQTTIAITGIATPTLTKSAANPIAGSANTITATAGVLNYTRGGTAKTANLLDGDATYKFYIDGSATAAQSGTSKTYDASGLSAGQHTITATVTSAANGLTSSAGSITFSVTAPATCTPYFTVDGNNATTATIYTDETVTFQGKHSLSGGSLSYKVKKDSGSYSSQYLSAYSGDSTDITFTPNGAGTYTIQATCSSDSETATLTVTVNSRPTIYLHGLTYGSTDNASNTMTYNTATGRYELSVWLDPNVTYGNDSGTTAFTIKRAGTTYGKADTSHYWVTSDNAATGVELSSSSTNTLYIKTVKGGFYTFAFDDSTKKLYVTYPTETKYYFLGWDGTWLSAIKADATKAAARELNAANSYSITFTGLAAGDDQYKGDTKGFKIYSTEDGYLGNGATIQFSNKANPQTLNGSGGNNSLKTWYSGDYTFTYTPSSKALKVTGPTRTVTVSKNPSAADGTVNVTDNGNDTFTLTATASDAYNFKNWTSSSTLDFTSGSATSKTATIKVTSSTAVAVVGNFEAAAGHTVTIGEKAEDTLDGTAYAADKGYGDITYKIGSGAATKATSASISVNNGATVTLTAGDITGYEFVEWVDASGAQKSTSATYTTAKLYDDATFYARYKKTYYSIIGTFDEWANDDDFTTTDGLTYTLTKTLDDNKAYEFKVRKGHAYGVNNEWGGKDFSSAAKEQTLTKKTSNTAVANIKLTTEYSGVYTFTFTPADGKLTVTYPTRNVTLSKSNANGTISADLAHTGDIFTATAADSYTHEFTGWSITGGTSGTDYKYDADTFKLNDAKYKTISLEVLTDTAINIVANFDLISARTVTLNSRYTMTGEDDSYTNDLANTISYQVGTNAQVTQEGSATVTASNVTNGSAFTATANDAIDGYSFVGWYDADGKQVSANKTFSVDHITSNATYTARYKKVFYLTFYNSYSKDDSTVPPTFTYITSLPLRVKIGNNEFTYSMAATPGEDEPIVTSGNFAEGNRLQALAGEKVELTFSSLASSDTISGIFFNNALRYTTEDETDNMYKNGEKQAPNADGTYPSGDDDWDYTYEPDTTLYADANYYTGDKAATITRNAQNELYIAEIDQNTHIVTWTVRSNYRNIDLELATKKQITFKDTTGITVTSKNTDNYYSVNEAISTDSSAGLKVAIDTAAQTKNSCTYTLGTPDYYTTGGKQIFSTQEAYDASELAAEKKLLDTAFAITYTAATGKFSGTMPDYDVVIDMNITTKYDVYIGSKMMADITDSSHNYIYNAWTQVAKVSADFSETGVTDIADYKIYTATADNSYKRTVTKGSSVHYSTSVYSEYGDNYLFLGWYKGTSSGPDMTNGLLSKKLDYSSYTPKANTYIWAVGTRMMYIGGSFYLDDGTQTYVADSNSKATWKKHLPMEWDAKTGRYSYTFTDVKTQSGMDSYHFRVYETETNANNGEENATVWARGNSQTIDKTYNGSDVTINYGRYSADGTTVGYFQLNSSVINGGYDVPVTIYFTPSSGQIEVQATYQWKKIYVSSGLNGYETGTTTTSGAAVTTTPNKSCTVSGQSGTVITTGSKHWYPNGDYKKELHVQEYYVKTKDGTVRVTKEVTNDFTIESFVVYEFNNHDAYSVDAKNVDGTNQYYADITVSEDMYIYPVLVKKTADMRVYVNTADLDTTKWGDLISIYPWNTSNKDLAGQYPGQLMVPSQDGKTWYADIDSTNLNGITFSNYYDGTWLQNQAKYSTVFDTYNTIGGGTNRGVQTYDYREPIALKESFERTKEEGDKTILSFSLKNGNIDLTSYNSVDSNGAGTVAAGFYNTYYQKDITPDPSKFDYLTNRDHTKYTDLNGVDLANKPTASFYVICKGNTNYDQGVNQSKKAISYADTATYSGNWSVEWYVYDASGKFITAMLSAGYADEVNIAAVGSDPEYLSVIAKAVRDAGYAYDGKAVAISYDYPQGYSSNTNYRYSGQWMATRSTTEITLNVKVGMKLGEDEDGKFIVDRSDSYTDTYGTASVQYTGTKTAVVGANREYATIKLSDADNKPVKVSATESNFLGWYTYDEETDEYKPISGSSREFNMAFNMDTTIYALYEAKATYKYSYLGRDGEIKYYSVSASNLTPTEVDNGNKPNLSTLLDSGETRAEEAARLAPKSVDITVFKKDVKINSTSATATAYTLTFDGTTEANKYTVTYYYPHGANNTNVKSESLSESYGNPIVIVGDQYTALQSNAPTGQHFIGWYDAADGGNLVSPYANFGYAATVDMTVYAHYAAKTPARTHSNSALVEENVVTREMYSAKSGLYYNDFLCSFQKADASDPEASDCGILIVYQDDINAAFGATSFTESSYTTALNSLRQEANKGKTARSSKNNARLFNITAKELSVMNRVDLVLQSDYATFANRQYFAVAYYCTGEGQYVFSDRTELGTYPLYQ